MTYKYTVGEEVTWKSVPCEIISRDVVHGEDIYTIRRSDNNTTLNVREQGILKYPSWDDAQETIPGNRDADYPVTEKDVMGVLIPLAVAAVVAYAVVRIIWR